MIRPIAGDMPGLPGLASTDLSRRSLLAALSALCIAPQLARAQSATPETGAAAGAGAGAEPWPRRFTHVFGETVVQSPGTRVVSLGYTTHDTLLALGTVPLAVRYWFGNAPFGVWPWAADRLGGAEPVLLTGEIGIEAVAALQPDLIIGIGSGIGQAEYELLSQIAPVIMQEPGSPAYGIAWQDTLRILARATGKEAEGAAETAALEAAFAAARDRHPDWAGKTGTSAYYFNGEAGAFVATDGRARFLTELGFRLTDKVAAYAGDSFYMPLSPEDISALDADVLLWIAAGDNTADLAAFPMRRLLKAHAAGREVHAAGLVSAALSYGSILSLPFALQALEADIATAADGDPATPVASAVAAGLAP